VVEIITTSSFVSYPISMMGVAGNKFLDISAGDCFITTGEEPSLG
jgi:hypothetical protein